VSSPTPDFPDWSTPVHVVDQALRLTGAGATIAAGGFLGPFDTSDLSSVGVNLRLIGGSGAERMMLALEWSEAGVTVATDYMTYADATAYAGVANILQWQVPVRGGSLIVRARGTNAAAQTITVIGSTRTLAAPVLVPIPSGSGGGFGAFTGRFLLDTGSNSIPAGGTSPRFYIPPVARRIAVRLNQSIPVSLQLDGVYYFAGAMAAAPFQYLDASTSPVPLAAQIDCPGQGLELTILNADAATHSCHAYAWDVS
jgi:hypothetical protein